MLLAKKPAIKVAAKINIFMRINHETHGDNDCFPDSRICYD
jgi:hypothetical protein